MQTRTRNIVILYAGFLLLACLNLFACAMDGGVGTGPISVAVWNPEVIGAMSAPQRAMGDVLAARILEHFDQSGRYAVVERESLLKVLEEQHLGSSELADDQTRLKLGRIIGCRQMVFGAYQVIGGMMRLDVRTVDVSSGRIIKSATGTVPADSVQNWIRAADEAARELAGP